MGYVLTVILTTGVRMALPYADLPSCVHDARLLAEDKQYVESVSCTPQITNVRGKK